MVCVQSVLTLLEEEVVCHSFDGQKTDVSVDGVGWLQSTRRRIRRAGPFVHPNQLELWQERTTAQDDQQTDRRAA